MAVAGQNCTPPDGWPFREATAVSDMEAFDQLPSVVRRALREAPFELSAETVLECWDGNGGPLSANQLVAQIGRINSALLKSTEAS